MLATINPDVVDEQTRAMAEQVMARNGISQQHLVDTQEATKVELERTQEARRRLASRRRHPDNAGNPPRRISTKA